MKPTSKAAWKSISMTHKNNIYVRIVKALLKLKAGGNAWEISKFGNIPYDRVWRRKSELIRAGIAFETPTTRPTGSGRQAAVIQLKSDWKTKLKLQLQKS